MRKVITLCADLYDAQDLSDWRQHEYNVKQVKRLMRIAQHKKRSRASTEEQKKKKEASIIEAHHVYIAIAQKYLDKACHSIETLEKQGLTNMMDILRVEEIRIFIKHGVRQINQIKRRVIEGEVIPHHEKVFSLFQPHTEWVVKGKAGVPVELGVKVCVLEDQHQFILHHIIMENKTDSDIAVPMIDETQKRFSCLSTCSFDKGFHSTNNQSELNKKLEVVALKRKGKLSLQARALEASEEFMKARHKHSAIESAINALEVHGLDMCPDHGINGFKRYTALAIVARNIHRIGVILKNREQKIKSITMKKYSHYDDRLKLAA